MSAGKSDVLCHRLHTGNGKWSWVDGPANAQAQQDSETFGWRIENAVPESLLLDARADASAASHLAASFLLRAERAEALAGELTNLLDEVRCSFTRDDDLPNGLLPRIDAAIDAVGGRGE